MATVYVGGASIDENGHAHGGKAGNQTGRELRKQKWYKHSKGWRVFRAKNGEAAAKIAQDMRWSIDNKHIGYDQYERLTLYNAAQPFGFNCKDVTKDCETDCSALVRVCCAYAGITLPNFRTPSEPASLLNSGEFVEMPGAKYQDSPDYLCAGDILCTKTQGHTVVVLNDGPKAHREPEADPKLGDRDLRRGDKGEDVKELQNDLMKLGYSLPKYGADGDFGGETEKAVRTFQLDHGLLADGVMQKDDFDALFKALDGDAPAHVVQNVEITGDSVNVRSAPGTSSRVLGVVHKGDILPYQGETRNVDGRDWYLVDFKNENGWVSSKYARLV
jgi:hypothetical protein